MVEVSQATLNTQSLEAVCLSFLEPNRFKASSVTPPTYRRGTRIYKVGHTTLTSPPLGAICLLLASQIRTKYLQKLVIID